MSQKQIIQHAMIPESLRIIQLSLSEKLIIREPEVVRIRSRQHTYQRIEPVSEPTQLQNSRKLGQLRDLQVIAIGSTFEHQIIIRNGNMMISFLFIWQNQTHQCRRGSNWFVDGFHTPESAAKCKRDTPVTEREQWVRNKCEGNRSWM